MVIVAVVVIMIVRIQEFPRQRNRDETLRVIIRWPDLTGVGPVVKEFPAIHGTGSHGNTTARPSLEPDEHTFEHSAL